jgi:hypothetical protein
MWPGYWSSEQPIIIYKPGSDAIMISGVAPPAPFQPVQDALPRDLRRKTYRSCMPLPGLNGNFNTDYGIGSLRAIAVKLEDTPAKTLNILFHEGFHRFQDQKFKRTRGADSVGLAEEKRLPSTIISDAALVATMDLERRILGRAVALHSPLAMKSLVRQYLAVRQQRISELPIDVVHSESNIERKEGSASIIGFEMADVALGRRRSTRPWDELKMLMIDPVGSAPSNAKPYERFRVRAYGSGAAMAWILTRLGIDWRERVQEGASFESLLRQATDFDPRTGPSLAEQAREGFGYAQLLRDAQDWKRKYAHEITREDFYKKGAVRLVVEFGKQGEGFPAFKGQGTGIPAQPEENVVIFMEAQAFELTYGNVVISAEKRPYMLDLRRAPHAYSVVLMLDELPRIDPVAGGAGAEEWSNGGTIEGAGATVKIKGPAALRIEPGAVSVKIGSSPAK